MTMEGLAEGQAAPVEESQAAVPVQEEVPQIPDDQPTEGIQTEEPPVQPTPAPKLRLLGQEFEHPEDAQTAVGRLQAQAERANQLEQELRTILAEKSQVTQQETAKSEDQRIRDWLKNFRNEKTQVMLAANASGDMETFLRAKNEMEEVSIEVLADLRARQQSQKYIKEILDKELAPIREAKDRMDEIDEVKKNPALSNLHKHAEQIVALRRAGNLHPQVAVDMYEALRNSILEELKAQKPAAPPAQPKQSSAQQVAMESPGSGRSTPAGKQADKAETENFKNWWKQVRLRS